MTLSDIGKLFDSYNRVARLYPAAIVLAPVLWLTPIFVPGFSLDVPKGVIAVLAVACALYFLSSLARSRGKAMEDSLLKEWGGWPSTAFLRHRDGSVDNITKARYHAALSNLCEGLAFPSAQQEIAESEAADQVYRSATRRLIETRRDAKYTLLHYENASYGFRRNLLGLKTMAVLIGILSLVVIAFAWWWVIPTAPSDISFRELLRQFPAFPTAMVASTVYVAVFVIVVNRQFVYQAACEYASALLRTLDAPAEQATKGRRRSAKKAQI